MVPSRFGTRVGEGTAVSFGSGVLTGMGRNWTEGGLLGIGVDSAWQAVNHTQTTKVSLNIRFIDTKYIQKKLSNAEFYATLSVWPTRESYTNTGFCSTSRLTRLPAP